MRSSSSWNCWKRVLRRCERAQGNGVMISAALRGAILPGITFTGSLVSRSFIRSGFLCSSLDSPVLFLPLF